MSTRAKVRNGWAFRYWSDGHFAYQVQGDFDQLDIVRMFASIDPVVRAALLKGELDGSNEQFAPFFK